MNRLPRFTETEIWDQCATRPDPALQALADQGAFAWCIDETGDRRNAKQQVKAAFAQARPDQDIHYGEIDVFIGDIVFIVGYDKNQLRIVRNP